MKKDLKIHSSDRCSYCDHWSGDAEIPFVIYSKKRAKWLEEAAAMAYDAQGDDDWLDWVDEGKRLTAAKQ